MIPKKIHYCWFGGGRKNRLMKKCMDTWKKYMPDYEVKEWNKQNAPMHIPYIQAAYKQKAWSRLTNYVRLHALFTEGGLYFDTDIEVVKSFNPLLDNDFFIGFQVEEERSHWFNNAVLGSVPGHNIIGEMKDYTVHIFETKNEFCMSPDVATTILKKHGLKKYGYQKIENMMLYPYEYFYPYPWWEVYNPSCVKENTYCIHHWEVSWASPFDRYKSKIKKFIEAKFKIKI